MIDVQPLGAKHALAVARLHQAELNTGFSGAAGQQLLAAYYRNLACGRGGCGYVALVDGRVEGFVCGVWDEVEVRRRLIRGEWASLAAWGAIFALQRPRSLTQRLLRGSHSGVSASEPGYELRPIVVSEAARGSGIALALVERLIQDARSRGFKKMHLYTEPENRRAQAFYAKLRFLQVAECLIGDGALLRWERDL